MKHYIDIDADTVHRIFEDCRDAASTFIEKLTIEAKRQHPDWGRFDVQYAVVMRIRRLDQRAFDYMRQRASATPRHEWGGSSPLAKLGGLTSVLNPWLEQTGQNFRANF